MWAEALFFSLLWAVASSFYQISCDKQWSKISIDEQIVTFIIPSSARFSLGATIASLYNQSDPRWLAVVMMDGVATSSDYVNRRNNFPLFVSDFLSDSRICVRHSTKLGVSNCAGGLRNYAVQYSRTPWVAFVDDDDTLGDRFVEMVARESVENSKLDCIIFRMSSVGTIHPQLRFNNFFINDVGISFAVKSDIFFRRQIYFESSNAEDYLFLDRLRSEGYSILLSEEILYFVKDVRPPPGAVGKRSMIKPLDRFLIWDFNHHVLVNGTLQAALGSNCSTRPMNKLEYPTFVFSEEHNIFFNRNIRGLQHSLSRAIDRGCLGHWRYGRVNISIIFTANHPVNVPYYIQVQLEQQGTHHFSLPYIQKLQRASQIWEFVPTAPHSNKRMFHSTTYFIPTLLMLDTHVYTCSPQLSGKSITSLADTSFEIFEQGFYRTCILSNGHIENGPIRKSPHCLSCREEDVHSDTFSCKNLLASNPDVIMFGKLEGSYNNNREKLCWDMRARNLSSLCFQAIFGEALNYFVCQSQIVVVERYFRNSALETHRIDPLLQAGKIVISAPAFSAVLDSLYSPVVFAPRNSLIETIADVSRDIDEWKITTDYNARLGVFMTSKRNNIDPLCHALRNLKLRSHSMDEKWITTKRRREGGFHAVVKSEAT